MKSLAMFLALAIAAVAGIAASQDASAAGGPVQAETPKTVTATGEIVRYDAGKTIVLRQADDRVVTYALSPTLIVPVEVQVGRQVSLVASPGSDGVLLVTQITTLAADAAPSGGQVKQTTTYTHDPGPAGERRLVTVTGDVVRYDVGKTIVVRSADGREVTYSIAPGVTAPAEVTVGRRVAIVTEPSAAGPVLVTRITTETVTADGRTITTTEEAKAAPVEAKSQVTTVYGTVTGYMPGKSLTVRQANRKTVTYTIDETSAIPSSLVTGRRVVVRTITRPGVARPLVRKVTFSKTTKTG